MPRIILEDIRFNKKRKEITPPQKDVIFNPLESPKNIYKLSEKKESKIDEYFKGAKINNQLLEEASGISLRPKRTLRKSLVSLFMVFAIAGSLLWMGVYFQKAKVNITPKRQTINYSNDKFNAIKGSSSGGVDFEIMIISDQKPFNIVLTEPKNVSLKSKGVVTLYNELSQKTEKIVAGTFLVDNAGKMYKTDGAVSIPGYKTENNKNIPGEAEVGITAFLSGDVYNGSPDIFQVNSFRGTSKYGKIYGKLKSPLSGGMEGSVYALNDENLKNIDNTAKTSFRSMLLEKAKALVPPGYMIYPGAMIFSHNINKDFMSKTPEANVEIDGTLSLLLLKEESLAANIIKKSLPGISEKESKGIKILSMESLNFAFSNPNQIITKDATEVSFTLSGETEAVWSPDTQNIQAGLAGIHKDNVVSVFREDPGVSSAIVKIFPPWQKYLPNNADKIDILIEN